MNWDQLAGAHRARFASMTVAVAVLSGMLSAGHTDAAPQYVPQLPDFYQHQWAGSGPAADYHNPGSNVGGVGFFGLPGGAGAFHNPTSPSYVRTVPTAGNGPGVQWGYDGGWCWTTAFSDILYQLEQQQGANGLFTHAPGVGDPANPSWLQRMTYDIEDTTIKFFDFTNTGAQQSEDQIIAGWVGAGVVHHDVYTWNAAAGKVRKNGVNTASTSMFTSYQASIDAEQAPLIFLDAPPKPTVATWWEDSYHRVAGAGYDAATSTVYFADPNNRGSGAGGANWGNPYGAGDAFPTGAAYYDSATIGANGTFTGGLYAGAQMARFDVYWVPEPATMGLVCFGFISLGTRRKRA